jgi:hypothetical protein
MNDAVYLVIASGGPFKDYAWEIVSAHVDEAVAHDHARKARVYARDWERRCSSVWWDVTRSRDPISPLSIFWSTWRVHRWIF